MLKVFDVPCDVRTYQRPWPSYTPPCCLVRADATYAYVWYTQNVSRRTGVGGTWHAKTGLPSILYCLRTESPGPVCYPLQVQKRESQTHISDLKFYDMKIVYLTVASRLEYVGRPPSSCQCLWARHRPACTGRGA